LGYYKRAAILYHEEFLKGVRRVLVFCLSKSAGKHFGAVVVVVVAVAVCVGWGGGGGDTGSRLVHKFRRLVFAL
jgi:hypothetical protein